METDRFPAATNAADYSTVKPCLISNFSIRLRKVARDAEQLGALHLIAIGFLKRIDHQLPLHRRDHLQVRIITRPLNSFEASPARSSPSTSGGGIGHVQHFRQEILQQDRIAFGHHQCALHGVFQFAHVAEPIVVSSLASASGCTVFGCLGLGEFLERK